MLLYRNEAKWLCEKLKELTSIDLLPMVDSSDAISALLSRLQPLDKEAISITAGTWRLWIVRYNSDDYAAWCLARGVDEDKAPLSRLRSGDDVEVIRWGKAKAVNSARERTGFVIGARIGSATARREGLLGRVGSVDEAGRLTGVVFEPGGAIRPPGDTKWFIVEGRDKAFDRFWSERKVRFGNYRNMLAQLANAQRRIDPEAYAQNKRERAATEEAPKTKASTSAPSTGERVTASAFPAIGGHAPPAGISEAQYQAWASGMEKAIEIQKYDALDHDGKVEFWTNQFAGHDWKPGEWRKLAGTRADEPDAARREAIEDFDSVYVEVQEDIAAFELQQAIENLL